MASSFPTGRPTTSSPGRWRGIDASGRSRLPHLACPADRGDAETAVGHREGGAPSVRRRLGRGARPAFRFQGRPLSPSLGACRGREHADDRAHPLEGGGPRSPDALHRGSRLGLPPLRPPPPEGRARGRARGSEPAVGRGGGSGLRLVRPDRRRGGRGRRSRRPRRHARDRLGPRLCAWRPPRRPGGHAGSATRQRKLPPSGGRTHGRRRAGAVRVALLVRVAPRPRADAPGSSRAAALARDAGASPRRGFHGPPRAGPRRRLPARHAGGGFYSCLGAGAGRPGGGRAPPKPRLPGRGGSGQVRPEPRGPSLRGGALSRGRFHLLPARIAGSGGRRVADGTGGFTGGDEEVRRRAPRGPSRPREGPANLNALQVEGSALERLGRRDDAIATYRRALRYKPDYGPARRALVRLTGSEAVRTPAVPDPANVPRVAAGLAEATDSVSVATTRGRSGSSTASSRWHPRRSRSTRPGRTRPTLRATAPSQ